MLCLDACRLGHVENARKHLCFPGVQPDPSELLRLQAVERHISKCRDARRLKDWRSVLKEADAAIAGGADSSPQVRAILTFSISIENEKD